MGQRTLINGGPVSGGQVNLTMPDGRRIAVRSQILARFEQVGGAMVGEKYNGQLLHRWLQKNAARALVKHQDEIV